MTGRIVAMGTRRHQCAPGWETRPCTDHDACPITGPHDHAHQLGAFPPAGTVWECDCGRTFVAFYLHDPLPPRRGLVDLTAHWRPEGWWERWRRLRRERHAHDAAVTAEWEAGKRGEAG